MVFWSLVFFRDAKSVQSSRRHVSKLESNPFAQVQCFSDGPFVLKLMQECPTLIHLLIEVSAVYMRNYLSWNMQNFIDFLCSRLQKNEIKVSKSMTNLLQRITEVQTKTMTTWATPVCCCLNKKIWFVNFYVLRDPNISSGWFTKQTIFFMCAQKQEIKIKKNYFYCNFFIFILSRKNKIFEGKIKLF